MTDQTLGAALAALDAAAGKADAGPLLDWAVGVVRTHVTKQNERETSLLRLCAAAESTNATYPSVHTAVIRAALEAP